MFSGYPKRPLIGRLVATAPASLVCGLLAAAPFTIRAATGPAGAPAATVHEYQKAIKTYPYSDPNPVPSLAIDEDRFRFYPYFVWNGYAHRPTMRRWRVVRLENPYIRVTVLPGVGGKVWGAIDKSTGHDFIYKNGVLKFRSIGIRGPWTSGGIEHNFGLDLGHAPWTASPVDYKIEKNADGSVGIVVGGLDLASRTQWRVRIKLPKDKAYFETDSLWYNATPLPQSYLSWENTAVHATDDLEFLFPGQTYVTHGGEAYPWPIDKEGRDLSWYRNNDFHGNVSYHVMGKYADWYGAYWHKPGFGFGHWAPYTDAPGKKIWIWSLARQGAIWEDLLTDTSGQYVELQSGVKFNQAVFGSGRDGPFDQMIFAPYRTDVKHEIWFPFKNTGGAVDASPYGVLNVTRNGDTLNIAVNALEKLNAPLTVSVGTRRVYRKPLDLEPMEVYRTQVSLPSGGGTVRVLVGRHMLVYNSNPDAEDLARPVKAPQVKPGHKDPAERLFRLAENEMSMRLYRKALQTYRRVLDKEPTHARALTRVAQIYYRRGQYRQALDYALRVLEQDTYNPDANFIYGIIQQRLGHLADARDGLSVASRSLKYRSGAYMQLASMLIEERNFKRAMVYAKRALNYNSKNLGAYKMLAVAYRHLGEREQAERTLKRLLDIDPLDHFAQFEQYLLEPTAENLRAFKAMIRNEFPEQTYLETAMTYIHANLTDEAVRVLQAAPPYPTVDYWLAYLTRDSSPRDSRRYLAKALAASPRFVFPFRLESIPVLAWAMHQDANWKTKYYLALIYWSKLRPHRAAGLFEQCGDTPDFAPFYIARGTLFEDENPDKAARDFKRAIDVKPSQWRGWHALTTLYNVDAQYDEALRYAGKAYDRFPDNQVIGLDYAASLLNNRHYDRGLAVLSGLHVLPAEHARQGHSLYEKTNVLLALKKMKNRDYKGAVKQLKAAKRWPEHLGEGKPYHPDTRLEDYLLALSYQQLGWTQQADQYFHDVIAYTEEHLAEWRANSYLAALAFKESGQPDKAHELLQAWREAAQADDTLAQWAAARFNGNNEVAHQLGQQVAHKLRMKLSSQGRGMLRLGSDWAMLRKALQSTSS